MCLQASKALGNLNYTSESFLLLLRGAVSAMRLIYVHVIYEKSIVVDEQKKIIIKE